MFSDFVPSLQIIILIQSNNIELGGTPTPEPYGSFLRALGAFSLDLVQMLPADCMVESNWTHYDSLLLETMIPILVLFCMGVGDSVQKFRGKESASAWKTHVGWFVKVILLVLPTISRRICQTFQCARYDDGDRLYKFLVADLSTSCRTDEHRGYEAYAIFMMVIYPIGVPLAFLVWLTQFKKELDDPSMDEQTLIQRRKQNKKLHKHPIASFALAYRPRYESSIFPV